MKVPSDMEEIEKMGRNMGNLKNKKPTKSSYCDLEIHSAYLYYQVIVFPGLRSNVVRQEQ